MELIYSYSVAKEGFVAQHIRRVGIVLGYRLQKIIRMYFD